MPAEHVLSRPALADARHARKNKKPKKRCQNQKAQCAAAVTDYCALQADPLACADTYLPCCARLIGCNVESAIACIYGTLLDSD